MGARIVFQSQLRRATRPWRTGTSTIFTDLGFPCHLRCTRCVRTAPPAPRLYHAARRRLLQLASEARSDVIRCVFFGGDAFALPKTFETLLADANEMSARNGVSFDAFVLSDGTSWALNRVRLFAQLGVRCYQVPLDGPPDLHDALRPSTAGEPSFARILSSLKYQREDSAVVVRTAAEGDDVQRLADILDDEGLFAKPHPVTMLVAPVASYRAQARDLLAVLEAPIGAPAPPRRPAGPPA